MRFLKNVVIVCLLLSGNILFAQTSTADAQETFTTKGLNEASWAFFMGEDENIYYVDFETISFNISDIVVKNEDGEVVLEDDVKDLPVNTIYEFDFNQYGSGIYHIELKSYTENTVSKKITVK